MSVTCACMLTAVSSFSSIVNLDCPVDLRFHESRGSLFCPSRTWPTSTTAYKTALAVFIHRKAASQRHAALVCFGDNIATSKSGRLGGGRTSAYDNDLCCLQDVPIIIQTFTRNSAIADKLRDAFRRQSRSPNMVPFHMIGMVSYYCAKIFDFKNAVTMKTGLRVREGN